MNLEEEEKCNGSCHPVTTRVRPHKDYRMHSSQQNSGVTKKKEGKRIEFEKFSNSNAFVTCKMNFKSEVCSSSSFPAEAMVWINEIDSDRNMDE